MKLLERFISIKHGVRELTEDSDAEYIMFIGPFSNDTRIVFDYAEIGNHSHLDRKVLKLHRERTDDETTVVGSVDPDKVDEDMLPQILQEESVEKVST